MSIEQLVESGKALGPSSIRTADVSFTFRSVSEILLANQALNAPRSFCDLVFCNVISDPHPPHSHGRANLGPQGHAWGVW